MTPDRENEIEKPAEPEPATELTPERMEDVVGGITLTTQPKLTPTSPSVSSLIPKVTFIPCI